MKKIKDSEAWKVSRKRAIIRELERLTNGMFKYEGIDVPSRRIERIIQGTGVCAIYMHDGSLYASAPSPVGLMNMYDDYDEYHIVEPYLHLDKVYKRNEVAIIRNNVAGLPMWSLLKSVVDLQVEGELTLINALINARVMFALSTADNKTLQSATEWLRGIESGHLGIIQNNAILESLKVETMGNSSPNIQATIEAMQYTFAKCLECVAIPSNWNGKRESLTNSEILLNDSYMNAIIDSMVRCRIAGCREIKDNLGIDTNLYLCSIWNEQNEGNKDSLVYPIIEKVNTMENEDIKTEINELEAADEVPEEAAPVEEVADEVSPAEEAAPVEEVSPAEEAAPVEEVADEVSPAVEAAPAEEVSPVEEAAPVEEAVEAHKPGPVESIITRLRSMYK